MRSLRVCARAGLLLLLVLTCGERERQPGVTPGWFDWQPKAP
jgi:hypothetical protein